MRITEILAAAVVACTSLVVGDHASAQSSLPNPAVTPGALNPEVTQETIGQTICVRGWTRTIRPPSEFTSRLKRRQLDAMRLPGGMRDYEEDHLVPLELGGAPDSLDNLWPEPRESADGWTAERKDALENALNHAVCSGRLPLAEAQNAIASDWTRAYQTYAPMMGGFARSE